MAIDLLTRVVRVSALPALVPRRITTGVPSGAAGDLLAANNLSDVASAATACTNLGLGTGDSPTFDALTLDGAGGTGDLTTNNGLVAAPGADQDVNLIQVAVTGTPVLKWDESADRFQILGHGLSVGGPTATLDLGDITGAEIMTSAGGTPTLAFTATWGKVDFKCPVEATEFISGTGATDPKIKNVGGKLEISEADTDSNYKSLKALGLETAGGGQLVLANDETTPPWNMTARSAPPSAPSAGDIYLDDGTLHASTTAGFRRYTGSVWEDIGGGGAAAGSGLTSEGGDAITTEGGDAITTEE